MRTQLTISTTTVYSFETEDFEQWQLNALDVADEAGDDCAFDDEALAGNIVEFLRERATH